MITRITLAATLALLPGASVAQSLDWQKVTAKDTAVIGYAVAIGREEQIPLYACRAQAGAGVQVGRFRGDFTGCHIGFSGQEISVTPFEVLAPAWQDAADGALPASSLVAGERVQTDPAGLFGLQALSPCRVAYQGSVQVGEVALGDRGCSFGFGGRQVTETRYQVLWQAPWMTWVPGIAHQLVQSAIAAGTEGGELFYICRAADAAGLHPGKIKPSSPGCSIASDGRELLARQFSLLVPRWVEGNAGTIPVSALPVGNEHDDLLYLCRAQMRRTVQVGKVNEQLASCRIGMAGGEIPSPAYEVLSVP